MLWRKSVSGMAMGERESRLCRKAGLASNAVEAIDRTAPLPTKCDLSDLDSLRQRPPAELPRVVGSRFAESSPLAGGSWPLRLLPRLHYRFVVDAGANRGAFTDAFLRLHAPERIILVEAIPELALKLRAKYARHPRISVVAAALSDRNGNARFEINRSEASSSLLPI